MLPPRTFSLIERGLRIGAYVLDGQDRSEYNQGVTASWPRLQEHIQGVVEMIHLMRTGDYDYD